MDESVCPTLEQLERYASGIESDEMAEQIGEHLEWCSSCEAAISEIESHASDPLVALLRLSESAPPPDVLEEDEFRQAMTAVCARRFPERDSEQTSSPSNLFAGQQIGEYDLHEVIGRGASGAVYRGTHRKLHRDVAIKILPMRKDKGFVERSRREMLAAGRVRDLHVVLATDAGEWDDGLYLVMDLIDGVPAGKLLSACDPLSIADACEIGRQAALGLQAIHEKQLVHRDIKPGNIIVGRDGTVRILDLGLALPQDLSELSSLTPSDVTVGSLSYMAPEQAEDSHAVDIRSDLYSLGATIYTLLAGHTPFGDPKGITPLERLEAVASGRIKPLVDVRSDVPGELIRGIERMMALDPHERPSSPLEVQQFLEPWSRESNLVQLVRRLETEPGMGTENDTCITSRDGGDELLSGEETEELASPMIDDGSLPETETVATGEARGRWFVTWLRSWFSHEKA